MARVPYVSYDQVDAEVKRIYDKQKESFGKVLNTTLVRAHCPELLKGVTAMQQAQEQTSLSSPSLKPLLTLLVSRLNGCPH